jgi:hypothetical protein
LRVMENRSCGQCVYLRENGENYVIISFMYFTDSSDVIRKAKSTRVYWRDMQRSYKTNIHF